MKKLSLLAFTAIVVMSIGFTSCNSNKTVRLKTDTDSVSYMLGSGWGQDWKQRLLTAPGDPINFDAFLDGVRHTFKSDSLTSVLGMDMEAVNDYVNNYFMTIQERVESEGRVEADKFLAENKTKSGVKTTDSGLQYQVITEGTGPKPTEESVVKVHYHGSLITGDVFQSTLQSGEPAEFSVENLIPGFKEGLKLMPVGSKYIFWIPAELAYFNRPDHQLNNQMLIFEIELLDIVSQ